MRTKHMRAAPAPFLPAPPNAPGTLLPLWRPEGVRPWWAAWALLPPFHPCTRMRPLFSLAAPSLRGPALAAGRKGKTLFCAPGRELGLLFPWKRGCESKARWVSVPHKARSEPLAFTHP